MYSVAVPSMKIEKKKSYTQHDLQSVLQNNVHMLSLYNTTLWKYTVNTTKLHEN